MKVSTISIDLAKNVFQVMGFTHRRKTVFNKRLNRVLIYFSLHTEISLAALPKFW
jgi:hypothetical protein